MDEIISFQKLILKLKILKRTGWGERGVLNSESVADHIFSVAILVMQMADKMKLNSERCLKMALLHELAEVKIGDITPNNPIYKNKSKLEKEAIKNIVKETGTEFFIPYIEEYDNNNTEEAKLVHDMDKVEMCLQALEYEKKTGKDLNEFFDYVKDKLQLKENRGLFKKILKLRK